MREPLQIVSAPGAVFGYYLFLFLYGIGLINFSDLNGWLLLIATFAILAGQIFSVIVHQFWLILKNGYQNIGYQKVLMSKGETREAVEADYDRKIIDKQNKEAKDYISRLNGGYLLNLNFQMSFIFGGIIFLFLFYRSIIIHNWVLFAAIIPAIVFSVSSHLVKEKYNNEILNLEKNIYKKWSYSCQFSFNDLHLSAFGRLMTNKEKDELYELPQIERNKVIRSWAKKAQWQVENRVGSDGVEYLAFWRP